MNTLRCVLAVLSGVAVGVGVSFLILNLGAREAGIWLAAGAFLIVVWGFVRYQSREAMRRERAKVWFRRDCEQLERDFNRTKAAVQDELFDGIGPLLSDLRPWPTDDDEVRR